MRPSVAIVFLKLFISCFLQIFPPKFPQGIAFRNFKNKWYPVCYDEARNAPFASSICTFVTGSGDTA